MGTRQGSSERPPPPSGWPEERTTGVNAALLSEWPQGAAERLVEAVPSVSPELLEEGPDGPPAWDRFFERAVDEGVEADLAELGRRLMREATLQDWPPRLQRECGLEDEGEAMLELAGDDPDTAEARWRRLLSR